MAYLVANNTTPLIATAADWDTVTNTPTLHASSNIVLDAGGKFSVGYTAPNTTNTATGVIAFLVSKSTATTITATLQENSAGWVDVAGANATITLSNVGVDSWIYFRFTTPYVFAATTAGYYRIKYTRDAGSPNIAADSGGSNPLFLATDNRNTTPTTSDDIFVVGANGSNPTELIVLNGETLGTRTDTSLTVGSNRLLGVAIYVDCGGTVTFDTSASTTFTCRGKMIVGPTGTLNMGTVASAYPSGRKATLSFSMGATGQAGLIALNYGKFYGQGAPLTYYKTKYLSGEGTAASPLITADAVDWTVGDEIVIAATSDSATNYNETEVRFIKTKNSSTSYVLSNTMGGAEAALTYTHTTDAWILNIERNVIITSDNASYKTYVMLASQTNTGNIDLDWMRTTGASYNTNLRAISIGNNCSCDYSVVDALTSYGFTFTGTDVRSFTGLIATGGAATSTGVGGFTLTSAKQKTLTDCFSLDNGHPGFYIISSFSNVFTRCYSISCSKSAISGFSWAVVSSNKNTFNDCESQAGRGYGISLNGAVSDTFNNYLSGSKGKLQGGHVVCSADTFNFDVLFNNCLFDTDTATLIANYLLMLDGSEIRFHKYMQTDNKHRWYTNYGSGQSTGAGMTDTNVRTSGSMAVRLSPEEATTGLQWEFDILARANTGVSVFGFIQKNAAFSTDDVVVDLYLPGSTTADDTQTMPDDTSWNVFSLSANYTGDVDLYATVRITAKSATASAYVYVDDIYNGSNDITALDVWEKGKPSPIMFEQLGDAAAVWAVLTSTLTTAGTTGKLLVGLKNPSLLLNGQIIV